MMLIPSVPDSFSLDRLMWTILRSEFGEDELDDIPWWEEPCLMLPGPDE